MNDVGFSLRDELRASRDQLIQEFRASGRAQPLLRGLSRCVDRLLTRVASHTGVSRFACLVAVGGYGRGELFPFSDVDVLILTAEPPQDAQRQAIEDLVGHLWDMGLHLGHSVRTVQECRNEAAQDVTVMTSMLEARHLAGLRTLHDQLTGGLAELIDPQAFFRAKLLEQQQRHTKYQDTPYSLEPNCKESPGGLRDLQVLLWIARAASLGSSWAALQRGDLITRDEHRMLRRSERIIKDIRIRLHIVAGRREDRLVFDVQQAVADSAGVVAKGGARDGWQVAANGC